MTSAVHPRTVLVGVDFDAPSASALTVAGVLAEAFGADVSIAHAASIELPPYFTQAQQRALQAEQQDARANIADDLRAFAAQHVTVPVTAIAEEGPPAETLLRLAPAFDLLVVGTHRYRGARRWWLGSVAEEVVRHAPVPVLVVPAQESAAAVLRRGAMLVTQSGSAAADPWVRAFGEALGMSIARTESIVTCHAQRLESADLVVVPLATHSGASGFEAVVDVLKDCSHPVLFVPAREPGVERS